MANRYWRGNGGNWSDVAHWSTSSGGAGGASVPTSSDSVFFDANSFSSGSQTVTIDTTANCLDMNWTGVTNTPALAGSNAKTLSIYGSLTFVSGMTLTNSFINFDVNFVSTSTGRTITMAGKVWPSAWVGAVTFLSSTGGWTLQDAFSMSQGNLLLKFISGSLNTNNQALTTREFVSNSGGVRTLTLGSSAISVLGWDLSNTTNLTFNAGTSTITTGAHTWYFIGGGLTYNNVTLSTNTGTFSVYGSNTFNTFTIASPSSSSGRTVRFEATKTQTFTSFVAAGTSTRTINLRSTFNGIQQTFSKASGTVSGDYLDVKDSNATGGATWNTRHSTDSGNNTGWTFLDALLAQATGTLLFSGGATRVYKAKRISSGTLVFSGFVLGLRLLDPSVIEKKTYLYKVYDEDNAFVGIWDDVIDEPNLSHEINTTGSALTIYLARNSDSMVVGTEPLLDNTGDTIDDDNDLNILTTVESRNKVGPGSTVNHNYRVDIFVFYGVVESILDNEGLEIEDSDGEAILGTAGAPNGLRKFTGFISEINTNYGDDENTQVQLMSYGYDLDQYPVVNELGETTVAFMNYDPSDIVKEGLDQFAVDGINTFTSYSNATIEDTGTSVDYTFRVNTYKELLETAVKLAPANWFYYVGLGDNLVRFKAKPSTPAHTFFLGKHIKNLNLRSYIGDVVNDVLFTGGGDPALYRRYTEAPVTGTRRGLTRLSDNRVTVEDSSDILSQGEIDAKNKIQYRSTVQILDKVYDIESIELGDVVAFRNFDNYVDIITMQIVGYNYTPDVITLALDTLPPTVPKRLEELRKSLNTQETETVPDAPS